MTTEDEAARKARAQRLHEQIDDLASGSPSAADAEAAPTENAPASSTTPGPESPRAFIHRRMQELKDQQEASS